MRRRRHVVLTGASSGLGAALAECYAASGDSLLLMGRDEGRLGEVAVRCRRLGAEVHSVACDVRDASRMEWALGEADARLSVTHVVANAGFGGAAALTGVAGEHPDAARQAFDVNLIGVVNTIAPLLPSLVARRSGRVAIIGSLAGYSGMPQAPAYCASKAAVRTYGQGLRRLLAPAGVGVTVVSPGFIDTPMSASVGIARPFLVTADKAAARIVDAVERGRAELAFPWPLALAARIDRWLPAGISDRLVAALSPQVRPR
ncbi:MAG: SDR family NAD(P)-dependent oxidoreductase [Hyphomicrobiaceae bacterium]